MEVGRLDAPTARSKLAMPASSNRAGRSRRGRAPPSPFHARRQKASEAVAGAPTLSGTRKGSPCGRRHRALGENADQMSAVSGVGVNVAAQPISRDLGGGQRRGGEIGSQRAFKRAGAENALRAGAGHGDPYPRRGLGDENADNSVARGRIWKLLIGGLLGDREAHFGDDLARAERRLEKTLEKRVCGDLSLVGDDRCAEREDG